MANAKLRGHRTIGSEDLVRASGGGEGPWLEARGVFFFLFRARGCDYCSFRALGCLCFSCPCLSFPLVSLLLHAFLRGVCARVWLCVCVCVYGGVVAVRVIAWLCVWWWWWQVDELFALSERASSSQRGILVTQHMPPSFEVPRHPRHPPAHECNGEGEGRVKRVSSQCDWFGNLSFSPGLSL